MKAIPQPRHPPRQPDDKRRSPARESDDGAARTAHLASGGSIASQTGAPSERFPVTNRVDKRVPEIDWDYAVIERLNTNDLATSLKPFNLGRALLEKDEKDNLELEPGDIVTIFSQADIHVPQTRQTTFVRLEGEFQAAGVYSVQPGETLRELVERAGGLTSQAYLFGSSFTRESTRRQQQAQLDEYSADLERDIERAAATRSTPPSTFRKQLRYRQAWKANALLPLSFACCGRQRKNRT